MPSWQSTSRIGCLVNNPTRRSRGTISPVRLQWTRVPLDFCPRWRYVVNKAGAANAAPALKYKFYFTPHFGGYTEFGIVPTAMFQALIKKNDLPKVVFHSLRHSSITYKLQLTGGDIKSVQGDSGHAQAQMVTDQYAHVMDDNRKNNAELFEQIFYRGKIPDAQEASPAVSSTPSSGIDPSLLKKISENPDLLKILSAIAGSL